MKKVGSLFDGSGGFPLASAICGITPTWASEVEPFPIRVTSKRFPNMKHLGDISKIDGAEIEPVDVITFGSPCQDLSVAGKRKGLNHSELGDEETTRSGLFMEAIRIIREMKEATNGKYPTFAVWENVPGAYSSNKGEDFRVVLEELEKTACDSADPVPRPPKGKWLLAGEILGDNYSIAWRTLDAQYWGVPQRRRRIYLVADFRGQRAGKILFEREGLRGNITQSRTQGQGTAGNAENGIETADREKCVIAIDQQGGKGNANYAENVMPTLCSDSHGTPHAVVYDGSSVTSPINVQNPHLGDPCHTLNTDSRNYVVYAVENHPADSRVNIIDDGTCQCLTSRMGIGGGNVPLLLEPQTLKIRCGCEGGGKGALIQHNKSATLSCNNDQVLFAPVSAGFKPNQGAKAQGIGYEEECSPTLLAGQEPGVVICMATQQGGAEICKNLCPTITAAAGMSGNNQPVICLDRAAYNQGINAKFDIGIDDSGTAHTLVAKGLGAVCCETFHCNTEVEMTPPLKARDYKDPLIITTEPHYIVRRLTPLECCRLQGFPDCWCSGLETPEPTEEDLKFWREVFETHRTVISGTSKPKTDKQIIKWLKDPYSDSAIYKMWGNGIALPNALFVMQGIAEELEAENDDQ